MLGDQVRASRHSHSKVRIALAAGLSTLTAIALGVFGGFGYAATGAGRVASTAERALQPSAQPARRGPQCSPGPVRARASDDLPPHGLENESVGDDHGVAERSPRSPAPRRHARALRDAPQQLRFRTGHAIEARRQRRFNDPTRDGYSGSLSPTFRGAPISIGGLTRPTDDGHLPGTVKWRVRFVSGTYRYRSDEGAIGGGSFRVP